MFVTIKACRDIIKKENTCFGTVVEKVAFYVILLFTCCDKHATSFLWISVGSGSGASEGNLNLLKFKR